MSAYSIALFVHVVGVIGFFMSLALEWSGLQRTNRMGIASMIIILLSGFFMVHSAWHHATWIQVTLATLVAIIAIGLISRRAISLYTRTGMTVGIVFLMTVKPDLRVSLFAIAVSTILGLMSAVPAMKRSHA